MLLKRLLNELSRQETEGLFTFSVVVADNDEAESAKPAIEEFRVTSLLPLQYYVEPRRGINQARNTTIAHAEGDYLAIIDDDEFPATNWLLLLFKACEKYNVDGVLGPVKRHFDEEPPVWLKRSRIYERTVNSTGMRVDWQESRTGNVLLRRDVTQGEEAPFCEDLVSGGDTEFFKRKIAEGKFFIWCAEAEVFEVVPPARWKRTYLTRKALMRGDSVVKRSEVGIVSIAKSMVAVPIYAITLPFAQLLGHHRFMELLISLCDHLGKLLALVGIHPIRGPYVSN
jgi:glycosyltransferase involved in cell wall biosynthesis